MKERIGVGIMGTGSIVNTYVQCIRDLPNVYLAGFYTATPDRKASVEKTFGVPVYTALELFLELPDLDLVCICTKSGGHGQATIAAARAGKHVLCEKPLEVSPEKVDASITACAKHGVKLGTAFQNRCGADFKKVHTVVSEGKLGRLLMGNAHINWYRSAEYYAQNPWRGTLEWDGGAAFMNQGIHTIDLLLALFGEVKSVFGTINTRIHAIEGEDVGSAILTFANGAIGNITAGTALYPGYPERLEIYGEKGSILMSGGKIVHWNVQGLPAPELMHNQEGSGASDPTAIGHENHKEIIRDMLGAIANDRDPMVSGPEARKSVEVITALYQSSKESKLIFL
ncbi:MAG: Gfo/Idh/MocA family oxidoreductase [Bacteroidota bacterium]